MGCELGEAAADLQQPGERRIVDMQVFPDGARIATLDLGGCAFIWGAASGAMLHRLSSPRAESHRIVRVLAGGDLLATGARRNSDVVVVWDTGRGVLRHTLAPGGDVVALEASPCGGKLATATWPAGATAVHTWGAADSSPELQIDLGDAQVTALALSNGGATLATVEQGLVRVWSGSSGRALWQLRTRAAAALAPVAFLLGSQRLVIVDGLRSAVYNSVGGGVKLSGFHRDGSKVADRVAVSPCGRMAAACGRGPFAGWAAMWDTRTGNMLDERLAWHRLEDRGLICSVAVGRAAAMADLLVG